MKKRNFILKLIMFSLFINITLPAFSEDTTPEPYKDEEFPQGLQDLRRFEIISLGSMPFVLLDTSLVYSGIRYAKNDFSDEYKPALFSNSSYTEDEQKGIIFTALGISIGIGLTDYIVQVIKRNSKKKKNQKTYDDISIYPISEDPDAVKITPPDSDEELPESENEIDVEEVENDVFEVTD